MHIQLYYCNVFIQSIYKERKLNTLKHIKVKVVCSFRETKN